MTAPLPAAIEAELRARAAALSDLPSTVAAVAEEPLVDHVIELAGSVAAQERLPDHGDLFDVLFADLAARVGLLAWPGALPLVAAALPPLLDPSRFAGVLGAARDLLPAGTTARLTSAAETVRADADALAVVHRDEWCAADLSTAGPGGAELVTRAARLLVGATLTATAAADGGDLSESAARRFAVRWLRSPAPETAGPRHRERTAGLLTALLVPGAAASVGSP